MSFRLDYGESLQNVVERLRTEHKEISSKLSKIAEEAAKGNLGVAISLLEVLKLEILRHAVEEEARLVRFISTQPQQAFEDSLMVFREHRRITEFLQERLQYLHELPSNRARKEIEEFVSELRKHHEAEERIAFPIVVNNCEY